MNALKIILVTVLITSAVYVILRFSYQTWRIRPFRKRLRKMDVVTLQRYYASGELNKTGAKLVDDELNRRWEAMGGNKL